MIVIPECCWSMTCREEWVDEPGQERPGVWIVFQRLYWALENHAVAVTQLDSCCREIIWAVEWRMNWWREVSQAAAKAIRKAVDGPRLTHNGWQEQRRAGANEDTSPSFNQHKTFTHFSQGWKTSFHTGHCWCCLDSEWAVTLNMAKADSQSLPPSTWLPSPLSVCPFQKINDKISQGSRPETLEFSLYFPPSLLPFLSSLFLSAPTFLFFTVSLSVSPIQPFSKSHRFNPCNRIRTQLFLTTSSALTLSRVPITSCPDHSSFLLTAFSISTFDPLIFSPNGNHNDSFKTGI